MSADARHRDPETPRVTDDDDRALAHALCRWTPRDRPAFTDQLLLDWECSVRHAAPSPAQGHGRGHGPRRAHARRSLPGRWVRHARTVALACTLPLCALLVQLAVGRVAEPLPLHELGAPDALSELSFDLL